jgi:hypothetical protein
MGVWAPAAPPCFLQCATLYESRPQHSTWQVKWKCGAGCKGSGVLGGWGFWMDGWMDGWMGGRDHYTWKFRGLKHDKLKGCTIGGVGIAGQCRGGGAGGRFFCNTPGGPTAAVGDGTVVEIQRSWQCGLVSVVFHPFEGSCVTASSRVMWNRTACCSPIWLSDTEVMTGARHCRLCMHV